MKNPKPSDRATLGDLIEFLAPRVKVEELLDWPPDAFAVAASALALSAGYLRATESDWPSPVPDGLVRVWSEAARPKSGGTMEAWLWLMDAVGQGWALHAATGGKAEADKAGRTNTVQRWLELVFRHRSAPLATLAAERRDVVDALLQIVAAADHACAGAGLITSCTPGSLIDRCNRRLLEKDVAATLCHRVRREAALVLPKSHTPQFGATIRSLTHNLALCPATEVAPRWLLAASDFRPRAADRGSDVARESTDPGLNLLIVPWPRRVAPAHFRAARASASGRAGYFEVENPDARTNPATRAGNLKAIYAAARAYVGRIDGVILPELALDTDEVAPLADEFFKDNRSGTFIAGVGTPALHGQPGRNEACFAFKVGPLTQIVRQAKHHRWCLDKGQIEAYGLGGQLDPTRRWWEHIALQRRELYFMPFLPSLTAAVLICEDLARQEPASQLIRAVGPNLVVALLMDGPQLASRWPGRYATVLADDPGSSVLSVTSVGMAELSRPGGIPSKRTVALWKDPLNGVREITLEPGAEGVVLSLTHDLRTEYTLDGRNDNGTANFLALNGVHAIYPAAR